MVCTMLYMRVTAGCVSLQYQNKAGNAGNSVYSWRVGGAKTGCACRHVHACVYTWHAGWYRGADKASAAAKKHTGHKSSEEPLRRRLAGRPRRQQGSGGPGWCCCCWADLHGAAPGVFQKATLLGAACQHAAGGGFWLPRAAAPC